MEGKNFAYIRVSTAEQNEARQLEALAPYNIDKHFIEKVSAKNMDRPEFQKMLGYAREGDTIYVTDFSRLSRSTQNTYQSTGFVIRQSVCSYTTKWI